MPKRSRRREPMLPETFADADALTGQEPRLPTVPFPPPTEAVQTLVREAERLAGPDDEWVGFDRGHPLLMTHGGTGCRRIVVRTKAYGLLHIDTQDAAVNRGAALFAHSVLYTPPYVACVAAEARRCRAEIVFVGDLDPYDLTIFLTLADGLRRHRLRVRHIGVGDEWMGLCRRFQLPRRAAIEELPTIQMPPFERRLLGLLEDLRVDWDAVVGPEAMDLLRSGRKLELEGATNPAFHRRGFTAEIIRHIFGPAKGTAATRRRG